MHASPAEYCLLGDAFGALAGVLTPVGVDDGARLCDVELQILLAGQLFLVGGDQRGDPFPLVGTLKEDT